MKKIYAILVVITTVFHASAQTNNLWYRQPAANWLEALPVGNGRMGAMVYGRPDKEIIQITEESVWGGLKFNDANPNAYKVLDSLRKLLFTEKNKEAQELAQANFVAVTSENGSEVARNFRSQQTLMNVNIDYGFTDFSNYRRELDITNGVATATFSHNSVNYKEEVFASAPDNVIMVRISADKPGTLNARLTLDRPDPKDTSRHLVDCITKTTGANLLLLSGQINDKNTTTKRGPEGLHMKFAGMVCAVNTGGKIVRSKDALSAEKADALVLYIQGATNYDFANLDINKAADPVLKVQQLINTSRLKAYTAAKLKHTADHASYMQRVNFTLGDAKTEVPTDERLANVKKGAEDPELITHYYQYGRYLLLGSSRRPGVLPANLQGVWNNSIDAPWNADFHTNINLQMNYWPAEMCNLTETTAPLFAFMNNIREQGRITAKKMYNARGWVVHHATDAFGKTGVQANAAFGTFPLASAWMCLHFYEHFAFTQDYLFLKQNAYPVMKEHALFVEDYLVRSPEGYLVTAPGSSPENKYKHPVTGDPTGISYGPTMDNQIVREFLTKCIEAANILRTDSASVAKWKDILSQLPPTKLTADGRIMEWIKDYTEAEPGHRHISHLFGLHPGTQLTEQSPSLFEGARRTLAGRLSSGGGHTGWSRAWIINFYARLKDGAKVQEHLQLLFSKSTLTNLFDTHPPFQIDGNFGSTAGITEALLQSHTNFLELLPALPPSWKEGKISGLRARGGFEVAMEWKDGELQLAKIKAITGNNAIIKYKDKLFPVSMAKGQVMELGEQLK
ncbi:glycoside hydrolase family 95 protein [uncultured Chitinophaga sp.]|uniref:glycoside hydrolase family 95 protein n=1 Tax=uncultured Chitinophaga sp. TaxID=339340 RepID=UPI0025DA05CC|nr:glycoside hydrolase family 95 protein [uncultured Chitinophaga sp.]